MNGYTYKLLQYIIFKGEGEKTKHFEFSIKDNQLKMNIDKYYRTAYISYQCSHTEFAHWSMLCKN